MYKNKNVGKGMDLWNVNHLEKSHKLFGEQGIGLHVFKDPFAKLLESTSEPKFLNFVNIESI